LGAEPLLNFDEDMEHLEADIEIVRAARNENALADLTEFSPYKTEFMQGTFCPMMRAFRMHKHNSQTAAALAYADANVVADDWRAAATDWFKRRLEKQKAAQ
jgi:hypothetical protein